MLAKDVAKRILLFSACCTLGSSAMGSQNAERVFQGTEETLDQPLNAEDLTLALLIRTDLSQSEKKEILRNVLEKLTRENNASVSSYDDSQKIIFKKMNIYDDSIAQAIKNYTPASVGNVLYTIGKKSKEDRLQIKVLDLSENYITNEGATRLFNEIQTLLPNLEIIDLSYNRLRDLRGSAENRAFEAALRKVLGSLKSLNLKKNYFGRDWCTHIAQHFDPVLAAKITTN